MPDDHRPASGQSPMARVPEVVIIIPARYASSRFPGKPLVDLLGKPMIQWVYERSKAAPGIAAVYVATDDERIADAVRSFGGEVKLTSSAHPTGTDRLAEVAAGLSAEIIVNVQGDEPTLNPDCISQVVAPLLKHPMLRMSTLRTRISPEEHTDPNVVKVVVDRRNMALYFSRLPLPYLRDGGMLTAAYKHIGIYAYRRDFLLGYARMEATPLEQSECLEQLRALENGYQIAAPLTEWNPMSIDTPEDVDPVLERMRQSC